MVVRYKSPPLAHRILHAADYSLVIIGHFIPTGTQWRKFFAEFFRHPFGTIASPSSPIKDLGQYIPPPADLYAMHNFPIGNTLPMKVFEEEEGMSDDSEIHGSLSCRSDVTSTGSGYFSPLD